MVSIERSDVGRCVFQCGECVCVAGDSERSDLTLVSTATGDVAVAPPLCSREVEDDDVGSDTTMYF